MLLPKGEVYNCAAMISKHKGDEVYNCAAIIFC